MDNKRLAQLHRNLSVTHTLIADEFMKAVEPPTPPTTPPPSGKIQCLITFVNAGHEWAEPIDVIINGKEHSFYGREKHDPRWNQSLNQTRGQVIELDEPITSVKFKEWQVFDSNQNDFNYKVGGVPADADLFNQSEQEGANFWARWVLHKADHVSVRGSISGRVNDPFYEYEAIPQDWSETGKFRIIIGR